MARDFAHEIIAATRAGDADALAALAVELIVENGRLKEATERETERRARDAERKRNRRPRNSEEIHGSPQGSQEVHGQSRTSTEIQESSPLPIPSSSFPGPHLTTPLTPLPLAPPPPARAREARETEPDRPHSELEVRLAQRLVSDADRNALTALIARLPGTMDVRSWLSEMQVSLDGMAGHVTLTPEQLGQALRDYVGNGAMTNPGMKHFRTYLRRASQGEKAAAAASGQDFDTAVANWVKDEEAKERQHA